MTKKPNEKHLEQARAAAVDQASEHAVGELLSHSTEDSLTTFVFASNLKGYVGWNWSVSIYQGSKKDAPTVSEVLLLPGEDALLAPGWVPWSERLADYKALQAELEAQAALEAEEAEAETDETDEADDSEDIEGFDDDVDLEEDSDEESDEDADDLAVAHLEEGEKA